MTEVRIVPCETCGSEGRILVGPPTDPNPRDCGPCPFCEGTGGEIVTVEPVEKEEFFDEYAPPPTANGWIVIAMVAVVTFAVWWLPKAPVHCAAVGHGC